MLNDPRLIDVLGVAMGIDMQGFARPEGSDELPPGFSAEIPETPITPSKPSTSASPPPPAQSPSNDVEMTEEDEEDAKAKKEAEDAKKAGNDAYKKRQFEEAAKSFEKAWELWPKDLSFLTNLGGEYLPSLSSARILMPIVSQAAYFEQGNYDKSIETCEKAVEEGRSVRTFPFYQPVEFCLNSFFSRFAPTSNSLLRH
jgi:tetratricopeptide (TPR) repeat protein